MSGCIAIFRREKLKYIYSCIDDLLCTFGVCMNIFLFYEKKKSYVLGEMFHVLLHFWCFVCLESVLNTVHWRAASLTLHVVCDCH